MIRNHFLNFHSAHWDVDSWPSAISLQQLLHYNLMDVSQSNLEQLSQQTSKRNNQTNNTVEDARKCDNEWAKQPFAKCMGRNTFCKCIQASNTLIGYDIAHSEHILISLSETTENTRKTPEKTLTSREEIHFCSFGRKKYFVCESKDLVR